MSFSRRHFLRVGAIALGATALAACGQATPSSSPAPSTPQPTSQVASTATPAGEAAATAAPTSASQPAGQAAELRWACYTFAESFEKRAEDLAAAFMQENPNIKVTNEWRPGQQYWEKIQTEFAAGTVPDITILNLNWLVPGAARGMFVDLTPYVARDNINKDDYFSEPWNTWSWKGKLWAGVLYGSGEMYFVNKSLFAEAGTELPEKTWTFDDLLTVAKALTKGEGPARQYGLNMRERTIYQSHGTAILNWGGKVLNEKYNQAIWADDLKAIEATQFLVDMLHKEQVSPTPQALQGQPDPFQTKKVAISAVGSWALSQYGPEFQDDLAVLPPPSGPAGSFPATWSNAWGILSTTKFKDESWLLVRYNMTEPGQIQWAHHNVPGLKKVAYEHYVKNYPNLDLTSVLNVYEKTGRDIFPTPDTDEWWRVSDQELGPMWSGEMGVEEAMKAAQDAVNAVFAKRPPEWEE